MAREWGGEDGAGEAQPSMIVLGGGAAVTRAAKTKFGACRRRCQRCHRPNRPKRAYGGLVRAHRAGQE